MKRFAFAVVALFFAMSCCSSNESVELQITYKGAQASRPADMVDVEEFVGVKSCKAKGKRLTTFDVATLTFIEPEIVEPEPTDEDLVEDVEDVDVADIESTEDIAEDEVIIPVDNSGTPIEIIRNDVDENESEQLNLF